jgi:hypothetical protein
MEWDYGLEAMVDDENRRLALMGAPLRTLFGAAYQHAGDSSPASVSLWYAQCGSVTRFLMRRFSTAQFARFCGALRDGRSMDESLRVGYDFAVPDVAALEKLWRESLSE